MDRVFWELRFPPRPGHSVPLRAFSKPLSHTALILKFASGRYLLIQLDPETDAQWFKDSPLHWRSGASISRTSVRVFLLCWPCIMITCRIKTIILFYVEIRFQNWKWKEGQNDVLRQCLLYNDNHNYCVWTKILTVFHCKNWSFERPLPGLLVLGTSLDSRVDSCKNTCQPNFRELRKSYNKYFIRRNVVDNTFQYLFWFSVQGKLHPSRIM